MEDTGKQKFEEAWREAMGDERVAPPEGVWTSIETQLDSESMKRRVIFYQRLAAASVLFAFLAGAFGFYWRDQSHAQLAQVQNTPSSPSSGTSESTAKEKSPAATNEGLATETVSNPKSQSHSTSGNGEENTLTATDEKVKSTRQPVDPGTIASIPSQSTRTIGSMSEPAFASGYKLAAEQNKIADNGSVSEEIEAAPLFDIDLKGKPVVVELVRKLPAMPAAFLNRQEKKYEEKWWASAGASAGGYNPNYSSPSVTPAISPMVGFSQFNLAAVPTASTGTNYGTSYSVALSAAHRFSRKWVVQSGMQYMARSIDYTTNLTNYSGNAMSASLADYATLKSSAVSYSTPYQLQSRSEYISVPLQVGYLLVDRKFGWMLNSGVSSDIFLRNTLTDLSGQRSSYSEGAGDNSPYRTFMWSALMSTEFSYKMGSHYRLAVVPGLRYSLNPMLKDESTQGNPVIWDVGFRFRYIFK
jgi:hypothetical protein